MLLSEYWPHLSISSACHMGYYKPANDNGGCQLCPANTRTHEEGSEMCTCVQGFSRLPSDPADLRCTSKRHLKGENVLDNVFDLGAQNLNPPAGSARLSL